MHRELEERPFAEALEVGPIVAHAAAVVGEAELEQQLERVRCQLPGRRAIALRLDAEVLAQRGQAVDDLGALGLGIDRVAREVVVAVMSDLVAAGEDPLQRLGMAVRGVAGDVERRGNLERVEQREDAGKPADDAVARVTERAQAPLELRPLLQPPGLGVDVERERYGDLCASGPARHGTPRLFVRDPDVRNLRPAGPRPCHGELRSSDVTVTPGDEFDPQRPLDPRDYSRRTLLANERTYLAWWRTGLTTLAVALACARVVPELSNSETTWPYTVVGAGFAVLGVICIAYGERRRVAVRDAIQRGEFAEIGRGMSLLLTGAGVGLGIAITVLILINP